jgi:hypothetical protein
LRIPAGLGAGLFFTLLAAAVVCAVLVVRARSPDLVLEVTEIEPRNRVIAPVGSPGADGAEFHFFVRESDPAARVEIVDSHEGAVAVLDAEVSLEAGAPVRYGWRGLTDDVRAAPPGRYRLRVVLPEHDREMVWPQRITVVRALPEGGGSPG